MENKVHMYRTRWFPNRLGRQEVSRTPGSMNSQDLICVNSMEFSEDKPEYDHLKAKGNNPYLFTLQMC